MTSRNNVLKILHIFDFLSNDDEPEIEDLDLDAYLDLKAELKKIDKQTLWNFWYSWSLGDYPSRGILFLKEASLLETYPEIYNAIGVSQNKSSHPEGDLFNHMMYCVDYAASASARDELDDDERSLAVFSALCHDMGKEVQSLTKTHEEEGVDVANRFLDSIGAPEDFKRIVLKLVRYHGVDYEVFSDPKLLTKENVNNLINELAPAKFVQLYRLNECDLGGRGVERSLQDRVSPIYREMSRLYLENRAFRVIEYEDMVDLAKDNAVLYVILNAPPIENYLRLVLNGIVSNAYLTTEEVLHYIKYMFTNEYNDALDMMDGLDYRDKHLLGKHLEENNMSVDELLDKGSDYITDVLNRSRD